MENSQKNSGNEENKRLIFSVASLIKRFNENPPLDETYNRATVCYEGLLDLIERPEVAKHISDLIKESQDKIRISALKIVNVLLFNDKKDPYMSLGLATHATEGAIKKRWKRLLMIYHPDKMIYVQKTEEVAKKINQAYREINELKEKKIDLHFKDAVNTHTVNTHRKKEYFIKNYSRIRKQINKNPYRVSNLRYLKYLPVFILIIVISIAIFSIVLLIINKIENSDNFINKQRSAIKIFTNIKMNHLQKS